MDCEGKIVFCGKCKAFGPYEEMSPYTHGWFGYDRYKHKDCGGKLYIAFGKVEPITNYQWREMSPTEREKAKKVAFESLEAGKKLLQEIDEKYASKPIRFNEAKYLDNCLTCPMCGSHVVKKLTVADRAVSVAAWGLASGKIGKQYECKKCGHKW